MQYRCLVLLLRCHTDCISGYRRLRHPLLDASDCCFPSTSHSPPPFPASIQPHQAAFINPAY
jgi:hypothetical protein